MTGTPGRPSASTSRAEVGPAAVGVGRGEPVGLVEHHHGHVAQRAHVAQVLARARVGRRTSAGRAPRSPGRRCRRSRSASTRCRSATESTSGRSSRTRPRSGASSSASSTLSRANRRSGATPSQSSSGSAPRGVPDAGVGLAGGGAQVPGRRQLQPGQRVEQARLADPGGPGQRDHGVVAVIGAPSAAERWPARPGLRAAGHRAPPGLARIGHVGAADPDEPAQRVEPLGQHADRHRGSLTCTARASDVEPSASRRWRATPRSGPRSRPAGRAARPGFDADGGDRAAGAGPPRATAGHRPGPGTRLGPGRRVRGRPGRADHRPQRGRRHPGAR